MKHLLLISVMVASLTSFAAESVDPPSPVRDSKTTTKTFKGKTKKAKKPTEEKKPTDPTAPPETK